MEDFGCSCNQAITIKRPKSCHYKNNFESISAAEAESEIKCSQGAVPKMIFL